MKNIFKNKSFFLLLTITVFHSCEDFVEIDPPRTDIIRSVVFDNDATANAAMIDVYYSLNSGFATGDDRSVSLLCSLASDIQLNYSFNTYQEFNDNEILPENAFNLGLWSEMYNVIYKVNSIIEGVELSNNLSENLKIQLEGEAKFIRAFCHFYLINLFGEVPLITSTNYETNLSSPKSTAEEVYQQIIIDLLDAKDLLPVDYSFANNEKVRVNKYVASAFLSRVYLYNQDWANAEIESTSVINNTILFSLVSDLNLVFRANSTEAIWQFPTTFIASDFFTFRVLSFGPVIGVLREDFLNNFEEGDARMSNWVRSRIARGVQYFYPGKYKSANIAEDYSTVIRLAEIYLIRAEARANQGDISGSQEDINIIRSRAGLANTSASAQLQLLEAIYQERNVELFTEHGHRWFDLKRTGRANEILSPIKGSTWQSTDELFPIPQYQILNSNLEQNPGY